MSKPEEHDPEESALYSEVARRIRNTRLREKLTQQELADKIGTKKSYIFELERGTANPTLRTLYRLGKALCLSASDFLPHANRHEIDSQQIQALSEHCHTMMSLIVQGGDEHKKKVDQQVEAVQELRHALGRLVVDPAPAEENIQHAGDHG